MIAEAPRREEAILTASASRDALLEARGTMHTFYNRNPRLYAPIADTEPPVPMSSPPLHAPYRAALARRRGHRPREEQTNARGHRRIRRPAVTIEMRPAESNLPRGVMHRLYAAARGDGPPLTFLAANALVSTVARGDTVYLLTGAGGPPVLPNGEVDGLLGTAALARVLCLGCRANVVILTEARVEEPLRAACQGAGLNFVTDGPEMANSVHFVPMPVGDEACREQAGDLLAADPVAVVTVESSRRTTRA